MTPSHSIDHATLNRLIDRDLVELASSGDDLALFTIADRLLDHSQPDVANALREIPQRPTHLLPSLHVRWMIRRDVPEVLAISQMLARRFLHDHWDDDTRLLYWLRQRNIIGCTVEDNSSDACPVRGFAVYSLDHGELGLLDFAVDPRFLDSNVPERLVAWLSGKLSSHRRTRVRIVSPLGMYWEILLRRLGEGRIIP